MPGGSDYFGLLNGLSSLFTGLDSTTVDTDLLANVVYLLLFFLVKLSEEFATTLSRKFPAAS